MTAILQRMGTETEWDLFRTFEAVVRRGGFLAAAKSLGLSQSTVSRHVSALEHHAGSPLFERTSPVRLTERGRTVLEAMKPMVGAALAARVALEGNLELRGAVKLTTVGEVTRWVLARRLPEFYRAYPSLRLEILSDNRVHSLAAGEADIALRGARPSRGELVARRLLVESFGFFASSTLTLDRATPWVGLGGALAQLTEARHAKRAFGARPARLLVDDVEALGIAVEAGLGVGILPRVYARGLDRVVEVRASAVGALDLGAVPQRTFWLVMHRAKRDLPNVRAVAEWLESVFARPR